jgi:hypothetical protein
MAVFATRFDSWFAADGAIGQRMTNIDAGFRNKRIR